jgi:hypothetical protein
MSIRLVIPAGTKAGEVAYEHRPETWQELADQMGCEAIEEFGSAWCVEHAIDGLGVCTEQSGQESEAQRIVREANESAAVQARKEREANADATISLTALLVEKGLITAQEAIDTVTAKGG